MSAFAKSWEFLKAIPLEPTHLPDQQLDAHFRESLPNFPLGAHMQTTQRPDYRERAGYGEPATVLGGEKNMRTVPISPYDSDITRQTSYQSAPRINPDLPDDARHNYRTASYLGGVPKTHRPPSGSNQALIDAISRLSPAEQYLADATEETHRTTHPTQRTLDEFNMSRDEYLQYIQENRIKAARAMGLDNNLPGGRLGMVARHSQDMSPPEYQDSVFE